MPSIARYTQQIGVLQNLPQSVPGPEAFGAAIGQSLNRIGEKRLAEEEQARRIAEAEAEQRKEQEENLTLTKGFLDLQTGLIDENNKLVETMSPDGSGHVENVKKLVGARAQGFIEKARALGPRAEAKALEMVARLEANQIETAYNAANTQKSDHQKALAIGSYDALNRRAEAGQYVSPQEIEQVRSLIAPAIGEAAAASLAIEWRDKIGDSYEKYWAFKDPAGYLNGKYSAAGAATNADTAPAGAPGASNAAPSGDYNSFVAAHENASGDPNAKNPNSSARSFYGFTAGTWNAYADRLGLKRYDPNDPTTLTGEGSIGDKAANDKVLEAFTADNRAILKKALGHDPDNVELYAAHFFGSGAAPKVLTADPDTPLSEILSAEAMKANPQLEGMTAGDWIGKMRGESGAAPASPGGPPQGPYVAAAQAQVRAALEDPIKDATAGALKGFPVDPELKKRISESGLPEAGTILEDLAFKERVGLLAKGFDGMTYDQIQAVLEREKAMPGTDDMAKAVLKEEFLKQAAEAELTDRQKELQEKLISANNRAADGGDWRQDVSEAQLISAFGEEKGKELIGTLDGNKQLKEEMVKVAGMSPTEREEYIGPPPDPNAPDYEKQKNRWDNLKAAAEAAAAAEEEGRKQFQKMTEDPVGFLIKNDKSVAAAFKAAEATETREEDPAQFRVAIGLSLETQKKNNIPEDRRSVMPNDMATAIVDGLRNTKKPIEAIGTLKALQERFGDQYWPMAVKQLVKAGLPEELTVATALDLNTDYKVIESVIAAAQTPEAELGKGLSQEVKDRIEETIDDEMGSLLSSLPPSQAGLYRQAAIDAALLTANGRNGAEVATRIAQAFTDKYEYGEQPEGDFRIPKHDDQGQPIDTNAIFLGVSSFITRKQGAPIDSFNIIVPPPLDPAAWSNEGQSAWEKNYRANLKESSYWVTDGDGLTLIDQNGKPVAIRSHAGRPAPLHIPFTELARIGKEIESGEMGQMAREHLQFEELIGQGMP